MKEHEIRPEALLKRYLELAADDARLCFSDSVRRPVACVACASTDGTPQFDKDGFGYTLCAECGTLFQSPRPPIEAFERFYRDSASSRYWAEVFFPAVAEIRREKIFRARVDRLAALCAERHVPIECLVDVGAGFGIFLDEWRQRFPDCKTVAVEPSRSMAAECRAKGLTVIEEIVEQVRGHDQAADLVTCFEVFEHVYDPLSFVRALARLARPGGHVFVTTLGIDGFDLQVLWDKSTQISPPHHLNFLSGRGLRRVFERAGLRDVSITTPGRLDVDIVRNASRADGAVLARHRFLGHLLADDTRAAAFQQFLADQGLSSHVWVTGQVPQASEGLA